MQHITHSATAATITKVYVDPPGSVEFALTSPALTRSSVVCACVDVICFAICSVGEDVVGDEEGCAVGDVVGTAEGDSVGSVDGSCVGRVEGALEGDNVGEIEG